VNPNPCITHAVSFTGVGPEPEDGCQFLRSKRISFSPEFENPKALRPVYYNGSEKACTNWQTCADWTWFTNSVLSTSTSRGEE